MEEDEEIDGVTNDNLMTTIQDYIDSKASKIVIIKVADDNWTVIGTVPKAG